MNRMGKKLRGADGVTWTVALLLLALPFTSVFAVNIGFALKIYEIAIMAWVASAMLRFKAPIFDTALALYGILFFVYTVFGLFLIIFVLGEQGPYGYLARISPFFDGLLKSFYALLCVSGFNAVAHAAHRHPDRVVTLWLYGAIASAALQFLFFFTSMIGLGVLHLPGMPPLPTAQQFVVVAGISVYRAGSFLEGNMAGPFFVLSFLLACHVKRYRLAILFAAAGLVTFSTTALIGFAVATFYIMCTIRRNVIPAFFILLSAILFVNTPVFDLVVSDKLSTQDRSTSAGDRTASMLTALGMFADHPVLGIGISQYGFNVAGGRMWFLDKSATAGKMADEDFKVIPNNVYVEIAAELGGVGILLFVLFVGSAVRMAWRCPSPLARGGVLAVLVFWLASPTFTLMYYWIYFGVIAGLGKRAWLEKKSVLLAARLRRHQPAMSGTA